MLKSAKEIDGRARFEQRESRRGRCSRATPDTRPIPESRVLARKRSHRHPRPAEPSGRRLGVATFVDRSAFGGLYDLLTFYDFPKAMWKSLRTTNTLENLNHEFRRRTRTQASFCTEAAAITLLYGVVAFGQIAWHRIDGHEQLPAFLANAWSHAA
jgi:mutator family transposase